MKGLIRYVKDNSAFFSLLYKVLVFPILALCFYGLISYTDARYSKRDDIKDFITLNQKEHSAMIQQVNSLQYLIDEKLSQILIQNSASNERINSIDARVRRMEDVLIYSKSQAEMDKSKKPQARIYTFPDLAFKQS